MDSTQPGGSAGHGPDGPGDEDRIEELALLRDPASERFAGRVSRAVDRVETAAHVGDFSGGLFVRALFEMASLLLGLIAARESRTERSE